MMVSLIKQFWGKISEKGIYEVLKNASGRFYSRLDDDFIIPSLPKKALHRYFQIRSRLAPVISDANPMKLIYVNPDDIVYYNSGAPNTFGQVAEGDWDSKEIKFEDHIIYQSIQKRYGNNCSWNETDLYREYRSW